MLRAIIFILLFNSFLFSFDRNLIFAPLPLEDKKTMYLRFSPMLDVLEKKLNTKIDINYNSSYDEILEKFIKGKIDFAYLGPLPYLTLEQKFKHIKPIVNFKNKKGEGSYTCSFVSFISKVKPFESIDITTKIALTQPLSTCGYLFVSDILNKHKINIEDIKYKYIGRHDKVALSVIINEFTYGGLKTEIAKEYEHLGLKILESSSKIPNFVLVANTKTLNTKQIEKLTNSMLKLNSINLYNWHKSIKYGTEISKKEDYNDLRKLINSTVIPHEGNF